MQPTSLLITLSVIAIPSAIAVILSRRWQLRTLPAWLVGFGWAAATVAAFRLINSNWPPIPLSAAAKDGEPWESVVYPLAFLCLAWPIVSSRAAAWPSIRLLLALAFSCLLIIAALCRAERFASLLEGNTDWALAALMALGVNWLVTERMFATEAGRWNLWIVVGHTLAVAAAIMTSYGRFGEWVTVAGLALAVAAMARVFVPGNDPTWSAALALPALALNSTLITHMREYRSEPLPLWLVPLLFLLPTLVGLLDWAVASRVHPIVRVVIAATATALVGAVVIKTLL